MNRLLVVLHIFYHDQADYFIDKMSNISGYEWDLVVTCSESNKETENKLRAFKKDVSIITVENIGYDVWPFIKVLKMTDFSRYSYVLKLHTKHCNSKKKIRLHGLKLNEYRWRNILVDSLLKSKTRFQNCMQQMESDPEIGYICSYELYAQRSNYMPEDTYMLEDEADRISMSIHSSGFCAGTMFLARLSALKKIKEVEISPEMWAKSSKSGSTGTLAHVYERIMCLSMIDSGYKPKRMVAYPYTSFKVFCHKKVEPVLKYIFALERDKLDKKKYLTLMGHKYLISE